jgi:hypothetical protein
VPRVSGIDLRPRSHVRGAHGGRVPGVRGHRQGRKEEGGVTRPVRKRPRAPRSVSSTPRELPADRGTRARSGRAELAAASEKARRSGPSASPMSCRLLGAADVLDVGMAAGAIRSNHTQRVGVRTTVVYAPEQFLDSVGTVAEARALRGARFGSRETG